VVGSRAPATASRAESRRPPIRRRGRPTNQRWIGCAPAASPSRRPDPVTGILPRHAAPGRHVPVATPPVCTGVRAAGRVREARTTTTVTDQVRRAEGGGRRGSQAEPQPEGTLRAPREAVESGRERRSSAGLASVDWPRRDAHEAETRKAAGVGGTGPPSQRSRSISSPGARRARLGPAGSREPSGARPPRPAPTMAWSQQEPPRRAAGCRAHVRRLRQFGPGAARQPAQGLQDSGLPESAPPFVRTFSRGLRA